MTINPLGQSRDTVAGEVSGLEGVPALIDDTQLISEALGIKKSGEVLPTDPPAGSIKKGLHHVALFLSVDFSWSTQSSVFTGAHNA